MIAEAASGSRRIETPTFFDFLNGLHYVVSCILFVSLPFKPLCWYVTSNALQFVMLPTVAHGLWRLIVVVRVSWIVETVLLLSLGLPLETRLHLRFVGLALL